jgi:hypothetical protein
MKNDEFAAAIIIGSITMSVAGRLTTCHNVLIALAN